MTDRLTVLIEIQWILRRGSVSSFWPCHLHSLRCWLIIIQAFSLAVAFMLHPYCQSWLVQTKPLATEHSANLMRSSWIAGIIWIFFKLKNWNSDKDFLPRLIGIQPSLFSHWQDWVLWLDEYDDQFFVWNYLHNKTSKTRDRGNYITCQNEFYIQFLISM